jgi:hypothetical protein
MNSSVSESSRSIAWRALPGFLAQFLGKGF